MIVAKVLLTCHEEMKDKKYELDLSWVCEESEQRHQLIPADVKADIVKQAEERRPRATLITSESRSRATCSLTKWATSCTCIHNTGSTDHLEQL